MKLSEPPEKAVRSLMRRQVDKVIRKAGRPETPVAEAVHDLRKFHKRARAMLRLVRPAAPALYRTENGWFRDHSRAFSESRDRDVLEITFERLLAAARAAGELPPEGIEELRVALRNNSGAPTPGREAADLRAEVLDDLRQSRLKVAEWRFVSAAYGPLIQGAAATYGAARGAMRRAYCTGDPAHFHEWRKQVKYHRHQMEFLEDLWPGVFGVVTAELSDLGDRLGDHQDLMVLRQRLVGVTMEAEVAGPWCLKQLDEAVAAMRARSRWPGLRLFAERRKGFRRRLEGYAQSVIPDPAQGK